MTLRVNGITVSDQAVEHELSMLVQFYARHMPKENIDGKMDELRRQAREQAIGAQLLMQEAVNLKIPVQDAEVDESLSRLISEAGGQEAFSSLLQRQKLTRDILRHSIRDGKRVDKLVMQITRDAPAPTTENITKRTVNRTPGLSAPWPCTYW